MAKKNGSAFDSLLETFGSDDDRKVFEDLAAKNPAVREYGLRQDEFSRRLDEFKGRDEYVKKWEDWEANNWDEDAKMTKAQKAALAKANQLQTEKAELEARLSLADLGGDGMTFDDLNKWGTEFLQKNNLVTTDSVKAEKEALEARMNGLNQFTANAALMTPYLNQKHQQEFGELFDPTEFVKTAVDKGQFDLKDFYENSYVVEKRRQKVEADHKAEIERLKAEADEREKKAKEEAEAKVARMQGMGAGGLNPSDDSGAQMGSLQRKMLGLDKTAEGGSGAPEVALGEGGLAAYAARKYTTEGSLR